MPEGPEVKIISDKLRSRILNKHIISIIIAFVVGVVIVVAQNVIASGIVIWDGIS